MTLFQFYLTRPPASGVGGAMTARAPDRARDDSTSVCPMVARSNASTPNLPNDIFPAKIC